MDFIDLKKPKIPSNTINIFNNDIPPLKRLSLMDDEEFEEIVLEWAYFYLKDKYNDVKRLGGAGDMGRDIIGYYEDGSADIYQCKHYQNQLNPSQFWVEFGKLCYYTYKAKFSIPKNYFIVTSKGIGPALTNLIENPDTIANKLIDNWQQHCKTKITKESIIELDEDFKSYIKNFDFSIVKEVSQTKLLDEYSETKWFKYRFGGGLPKRAPLDNIPEEIEENEETMTYINQLVEVYMEKTSGNISSVNDIEKNERLKQHFHRQRVSFHSSQALRRFTRDELIDESAYEQTKEEIFNSVIDMIEEDYKDGYTRLTTAMNYIRTVQIDIYPLGFINPVDKCGTCHVLVNEERFRWIYDE